MLFDIDQHDLHADNSLGFANLAADQIVRHTTLLERQNIAKGIRARLTDEEEEVSGSQRNAYGKFLPDRGVKPRS